MERVATSIFFSPPDVDKVLLQLEMAVDELQIADSVQNDVRRYWLFFSCWLDPVFFTWCNELFR